MSEQRRTHRLNIQLPAQYKINSPNRNFLDALVMNINVKGVCLVTRERLSVGDSLLMNVELPGQSAALVEGTVIWTKESSPGKEYASGLQLSESMRHDEAKFVRYYASRLINLPGSDADGAA